MSEPGLEAIELAVGYGRQQVASNVNLRVQTGQVVCLLGPNGSGKSTLLRTLLGLQPPLEGQVKVQGKPLEQWRARALARQLAYVPQAQDSAFAFTVEQWVLLGCASELAWYSQPRAADRQWVGVCLERLGIGQLAQKRTGERKDIDTTLENGKNYGFEMNSMRIVANKEFTEKNPAAAKLFEIIKLNINDVSAQNMMMSQGKNSSADIESHVNGWIKANQKKFDAWVDEAKKAAM